MTNGSCQSTCESNVQPYRKPRSSASRIRSTTSLAGGSGCSTSPKSTMPPLGPLRPMSGQVLARAARQETAVTKLAAVLTRLHQHSPAGQHRVHPAGDVHALVGRVVDIHVMTARRQLLGRRRVVDHDVGV